MTLTAEQYERLIENAASNMAEYGDESDYGPIIDAARADLAAMHQPITPEALVLAGWETTSREEYDDSANAYYQRWIPPDTRAGNYWLSVEWFAEMEDEPEKIRAILHGEDDEVVLPNVTTMYQLGQLVELLGGAK